MSFRKKFRALLFFVTLSSGFFVASFAHAATLSISPANKSVNVGQNVSLDVVVSSGNQAINVVSGKVTYDKKFLKPVSVSKSGTIVKFWIQEPDTGSNSQLVFEGVILNPGYTGLRGHIITLTFTAIAQGDTTLAINNGTVLANDGVGTNVFSGVKDSTITISPKVIVEEKPVQLPTQNPSVPPVVDIPTTQIDEPIVEKSLLAITDYPLEVEEGQPVVIHGQGSEVPLMVYAVSADGDSVWKRTIVYQSLTDGGYNYREEAVVNDGNFTATFDKLPSGRYAFYAKDSTGAVTRVIFINVHGNAWSKILNFIITWWWVWLMSAVFLGSIRIAYKLGQRNIVKSMLDR